MKHQWVRHVAATLLGTALMAAALPNACAVVIAPGGATGITGTTSAARPELAGLVLEDTIRNWTISTPHGDLKGQIQDRVVRENVAGTLDFYTRIFVTQKPDVPGKGDPGPFTGIEVADRSSFASFLTDVDFRIDGLGNTAPTRASRSADGSLVEFLFGSGRVTIGDQPDGSKFFFIKTNATAFNDLGIMKLGTNPGNSSNFTTSFNVYQPVPEPSSFALLLAGLLSGGFVAYRRSR